MIKEFLNKKIPSYIAIGIIALLAIFVARFTYWQYMEIVEEIFEVIEVQIPEKKCSDENPDFCNKNCSLNDDCKFTCGCGCISKDETCPTNIACFMLPSSACKCVDNKCLFDETHDWQTYRNEEYGFEVKYPPDITAKDWTSKTPNWELLVYIGNNDDIGDGAVMIGIEKGINNLDQKSFFPFAIKIENLEDVSIGEDGYPAKKFSYKGPAHELEEESDFSQYFIEHSNSLYQIHFDKLKDLNEETFDQMLSTFKFREEEPTGMEDLIINKVLPADFSKNQTKYLTYDLNGDGKLEIIISSAREIEDCRMYCFEGYTAVVTVINKKGDYEKVGELKFDGGARGVPAVKEVIDIDSDNQKEIFLYLGTGGASTNDEGILDCDFQNHKLNWVKIQDENGKIEDAIFSVGAAVAHSDDYIIEDLDNDGQKEIIKLKGQISLYINPEDLKPWEKLVQWDEGTWWKWEARVYEWNGPIFSYSEDLSEKYWSK